MRTLLRINLSLFLLLLMSTNVSAQKKYAVIITGDYASITGTWAIENGEGRTQPMEEFWNDTYLMWELLQEKGYSNSNIYVLFADGEDYQPIWIDDRYNPQIEHGDTILPPDGKITDYEATKENVVMVLTSMADGSNPDIPQLTEDDFLYVFTFDHGYYTMGIDWDPGVRHTLIGLMGYNQSPEDLWDYDLSIADFEMQTLLGNISAGKKLVVMQQCLSGGFIPYLENESTVICTAASELKAARKTDQDYYDSIDFPGDPYPGTEYSVESENEKYEVDGHKYLHGEFDLHFLNASRGITPAGETSYYVPEYQDFPLSDADLNQDNIISISETFQWVLDFDSRMRAPIISGKDYDDPQISSSNDMDRYTSLEYPTLMFEDIGPIGNISVKHRGIIGITKDVHIKSSNQLTFLNDADVYLLNDAKLIVEAGATLVLEDNVSIIATNESNKLEVYGELQVGDNISFSSEGENPLVIIIANTSLSVSFDYSTFLNTLINCESNSLSILSSDLTFSAVQQTTGDLNVLFSTLNNSSVKAVNTFPNNENSFVIAQNLFTNGFPTTNAIVEVDGYTNYLIEENTIQNDISTTGVFYGISVNNSGGDRLNYYKIEDNSIISTTACGNQYPCAIGLSVFSSYAEITNNIIKDNDVGIEILHNSITEISGDKSASIEDETQLIKNNNKYQVFISSTAFPTNFHWNAIYEDTYNYYFIFREIDPGVYPKADVRYNYWGNNFDADINLYPLNHYGYEPTWNLGGGSPINQTDAGQLYLNATDQVADSAFGMAKSTFKQVVITYPETDFAKSSMRELLNLEPLADNKFSVLKYWYLTEPVVQNNDLLKKIGNDLAAKCDERLENYSDAITWYESVIENPETLEDSIFAIIDLEHVYLQMGIDTNLRSGNYIGRMPQYKPASIKAHQKHRNELLALLLKYQGQNNASEDDIDNDKLSQSGLLFQNAPNPFKGSTQIPYKLKNTSDIKLHIYSYTGQLIKTINVGIKSKGTHSIEFDASDLKSGLYFYSICINGQNTDSRKMTIIH